MDDGAACRRLRSRGGQRRPPVAGGYGVRGWVRSSEVVRFDDAIEFYTHEIQINPGDNYRGYLQRAVIWHKKRETDLALADYNQVILLDAKDPSGFSGRGAVWSRKGSSTKRWPISPRPSASTR